MQPSITLSTAAAQGPTGSTSASPSSSSTPLKTVARELSPPTSPSPRSQSPARRSLSPGPPTTLQQAQPTLSPKNSRVFASRPSPVVPSPSVPGSPASFSRPTSPRPQVQHATATSDATPHSPTLSKHHPSSHAQHQHQPQQQQQSQHGPHSGFELSSSGMISRSASNVDLSHVFERDVEFASTHRISAQEAVDVAIAPVLDEAAVVLTSSNTDLTSSISGNDLTTTSNVSGWSSPVPSSSIAGGPSYVASRSPTRPSTMATTTAAATSGTIPPMTTTTTTTASEGNMTHTVSSPTRSSGLRSLSPESASRAASPGSSTSFSIGTPPDDQHHYQQQQQQHPFTQHLSDALERERTERGSTLTSLTNTTKFYPMEIVGGGVGGGSIPGSPNPDQVAAGVAAAVGGVRERALSFTSYADVINEERLAELTGAPAGGEPEPQGHVVDIAGVLDKLELSGLSIHTPETSSLQ
ncbi:hypothetical protein OIO90_002322 [Microbotryomycetes sp. JL221]|nr:hypothetical protein OIO90_002322 [Microbotryomycetes sp. JL221]